MNSKLLYAFAFVAGAAVGSLATWKFFKTKYERIAKEEIDSVKEVYYRDRQPVQKSDDESPEEEHNLENAVPDLGYDRAFNDDCTSWEDYVAKHNKRKEDESMLKDKPYVIPPEEFGDADGYDCISLTYYSDGILTDDWDNPIEDVEGMVGKDSLTHFGEYEDDSVFVRNDHMKAEFEILLDSRKYSDVMRMPAQSDEE